MEIELQTAESTTQRQQANASEALSNELMFEYGQLRGEILKDITLSFQTTTTVVVLTSTLMTLAFTEVLAAQAQVQAVLFFLVEAVAFAGLYYNLSRVKDTYRIATYLKTFIEPKTEGIRWETRLDKFRNGGSDIGSVRTKSSVHATLNVVTDQRTVYAVIIIASFVAACYCIREAFGSINYVVWLIWTIGLIITIPILAILWRQYDYLNHDRGGSFERKWKDIKKEEQLRLENSTKSEKP
jgi:hypothetical protein